MMWLYGGFIIFVIIIGYAGRPAPRNWVKEADDRLRGKQ